MVHATNSVNLKGNESISCNMKAKIVEILEAFWPKNKAKGLLAQTVFKHEIEEGGFGRDAKEKTLSGCWLLAPKESDFYKFRFCFFVHSSVMKTSETENDPKNILGDTYRPFHAISEFMCNAGIGVVYVIPTTENGELPLDEIKNRNFENIRWKFFTFENGNFVSKDPIAFFGEWAGSRGRAGPGSAWDPQIKRKIEGLDEEILTELLLNELFYTGFLKGVLKKPFNDPYDVDSFFISLSQKHIFPVEIKEKFPGETGKEKYFGIDAGRIMMQLRLCLPNDANAIYLIREVNEDGRFVGWKYMTLSDIIMTSSWNLQAGGPGMGGQATQTIRLPYDYFKTFDANRLSEDKLKEIGNLPKDIKGIARQFGTELSSRFYH